MTDFTQILISYGSLEPQLQYGLRSSIVHRNSKPQDSLLEDNNDCLAVVMLT